MDKKDLLMMRKTEREYAKRQVLAEIRVLRGRLNHLEERVNDSTVTADDGLQGNEWRLYKELSNLERLNQFVQDINQLED